MDEIDGVNKIGETNQINEIPEPCRSPALNFAFVNLIPAIFTVNVHDLLRATPAG